MAFAKTYEVDHTGVVVTYWNIAEICVTEQKNTVVFQGFKDEQARIDGKKALTTQKIEYFGSDRPITREVLMAGNALAACYAKAAAPVASTDLHTNRFFVGATPA